MAQAGEDAAAARAEAVAALAPEALKRLEALEEIQKASDVHQAAMLEERKALELKYHLLYAETWKSRSDILLGTTDPAGSTASVGIAKFWLQAMQNHPAVADFIEDRDETALTSLKDITWEYLPEMKGFKLQLTFGPNDFFEDAILTKEFYVPNLLEGKAIELEKSVGCEIHWKPGKDLTHETVTKKVGKGKGKNKKSVTKVEPCPSFFRFFESIEFDEAKARDMEQDEVMAIYQQMQAEADVGFALKNKIVPNAVHWFTGEAKDDEDDEDDDEYDGEDDDEEDDGDNDDDEEEEEKPKKGGKGGKGGKKKASEDEDDDEEDEEGRANALKAAFEKPSGDGPEGGADKPPECKQQ